MGAVPGTTSLIFTGVILVFLVTEGSAVECYVCSWSPYDHHNDTCTSTRFNPERVPVHECDRGCEIVSMRDGNGEMEMFYRNCYTKTDNNYAYSKKNTRLNEEEVYKCNSKRCNGSSMVTVSLTMFGALALFRLL